MIEHIQKEYEQEEGKEKIADTLKKWITRDAFISPGLTKKLTQSEERVFRNKKYFK